MILVFILLCIVGVIILISVAKSANEKQYKEMESAALSKLGFSNWNIYPYFDEKETVRSRQALEKYDEIKFFKENKEKLKQAEIIVKKKNEVKVLLNNFLENNEYKTNPQYDRLKAQIYSVMQNAGAYRINVQYVTSANNCKETKEIALTQERINQLQKDPSLLMGKGEYTKYVKEQQKLVFALKQHEYYELVNSIIDYANNNKDALIIHGSRDELDNRIASLYDDVVSHIKKIKTANSEEWNLIGKRIYQIKEEIEQIVDKNQKILDYYNSVEFSKIKETCAALMSSQREFNEYISEKVQSISNLFGTRTVRNETVNNDENNYVRPYKKTITPFTAEVSVAVFASAENNPLEYVVKNFYPDKSRYPEQIRKLYQLVEELETLKDAKQIIENYKAQYQQYLGNVPGFIMENDESGFYARLGFAYIDESTLTVEYKFSYTSGGGMVQRHFTVSMTENTISELIKLLESKLNSGAFAKEQRSLMTKRLRDYIKKRDNYTCCICGNSTYKEPNLLLEIDHIIPVAKGGYTTEKNLQTLCWKCNRSKSDKITAEK